MGAIDVVIVGGGAFIDVRQGVEIPPAVVLVGPWMEVVPGGVGRLLGIVRAFHRVALFAVEIDAVAARVVEDAVHDHMHPALFCCGAQMLEVGLRAEQGVDFGVIRRIVPVVGVRFKDGVQVDAGHAEGLQIGELFFDALQVPAKVVRIGDDPPLIRLPIGLFPPMFMQFTILGDIGLGRPGIVKTVREDLVHNPAGHPVGRVKAGVVDGELPRPIVRFGRAFPAKALLQFQRTPPCIDIKPIEIEAGRFGRKVAFPPFVVFSIHPAPKHAEILRLPPVVVLHHQSGGGTFQVARDVDAEMDRRLCGYCARWIPVSRVA